MQCAKGEHRCEKVGSSMLKYICQRIIYIFFVFLILSGIIFFLYNSIPGDPALRKVSNQIDKLTEEQFQISYERAREELGLNDPIPVRYVKWLKNIYIIL